MKILPAAVSFALFLTPSCPLLAEITPPSATLSRDVDGIALGMTIAEVRGRMKLEHVAFETFRGSVDGIDFDLGFTPAGRVFRIQSSQDLGRFHPDQAFTKTLSAKLIAKYGAPESMHLPDGTATWSLVQQVSDASGESRPFQVMWASAMLVEDEGRVFLQITMLDFRILWEDEAKQNGGPSAKGVERVRL